MSYQSTNKLGSNRIYSKHFTRQWCSKSSYNKHQVKCWS